VERGDLDDRLDLNYYHPRFAQITQVLDRSVYPVVPLGKHITSIKYGASVKPRYVPEGIPLLRILNLKPNEIDLTDVVKLPEEMRDQLGSAFVQEGDLLISRSGTIGVVAVVDEKANGYAYGSFMIRFSVDDKVAPRYIAYFCNLPMVQLQIQRKRIGAVQGNITIPTIRSLRLPLPPVEVQQDIANRMYAAYRCKRELEAEAEALLESIDGYVLGELGTEWGNPPDQGKPVGHEAVWFGTWRWDVKRLDPKRYRYQRKGPEPKGLCRLGDLLTKRLEKVDRSEYAFEDLQLISLHFDGSMSPRDVKAWRKDIKGTLWFAYPSDLVYSKIDARNGAIGLVPDELGRVAVTSEYPVYQVKEGISAEYLKIVLRTPQFTDLLKAMAAGHSGRKRVQPGELEDVLIPVPSLDQQHKIAGEVQRRRQQAVALWEEAERVVAEAKAEVERMILGEGEI